MEKDFFNSEIKRLAIALRYEPKNRKKDIAFLKVVWNTFKQYEESVFKKMITELCLSARFFPNISEFDTVAKKYNPRHRVNAMPPNQEYREYKVDVVRLKANRMDISYLTDQPATPAEIGGILDDCPWCK